jgi:hypothetical protein
MDPFRFLGFGEWTGLRACAVPMTEERVVLSIGPVEVSRLAGAEPSRLVRVTVIETGPRDP